MPQDLIRRIALGLPSMNTVVTVKARPYPADAPICAGAPVGAVVELDCFLL